jgi:hypothetical protein
MTRFSLVNESLFSVPVYFGHEATKKNLKVNRVTEITEVTDPPWNNENAGVGDTA